MKKILYDQVTGKAHVCEQMGIRDDITGHRLVVVRRDDDKRLGVDEETWSQLADAGGDRPLVEYKEGDRVDTQIHPGVVKPGIVTQASAGEVRVMLDDGGCCVMCGPSMLRPEIKSVNPHDTALAWGERFIRTVIAQQGAPAGIYGAVRIEVVVSVDDKGEPRLSHEGEALVQLIREKWADLRTETLRKAWDGTLATVVTTLWTDDYKVGDKIEVNAEISPGEWAWQKGTVRAKDSEDVLCESGPENWMMYINNPENIRPLGDAFDEALNGVEGALPTIDGCDCSSSACTWRGSAHCRHNPHQAEGSGRIS